MTSRSMRSGFLVALVIGIISTTLATHDPIIHGERVESNEKFTHCTRTAIGNLIIAELYKMSSLKSDNFINEARRILTNLAGGNTESCKKRGERLDGFITAELQRLKFPPAVVNCPVETIPYNLFLCKMDWPEDLMELLPSNLCGSSCAEIHIWHNYHVSRAVKVFPPGWYGQLGSGEGEVLDNNARRTDVEVTEFDLIKDLTDGLETAKIEYAQQRVKRDTTHGVFPIKTRYVKQFYNTNIFSPGNFTRQAKCHDDEWIYAIEDGLPFGLTIHCNGTRGFGRTRTIGNLTGVTTKLIECSKQVEYRPTNGSYLIGMSNRINYKEIEFLVAGAFLCSGDERWSEVKDREFNTGKKTVVYDTRNGTGEIVKCRLGQMICTIELKTVRFENKSFTTDVRVGCCEAPVNFIYSSMTVVPIRPRYKGRWVDDDITVNASLGFKPFVQTKHNFSRDYYAEPYGAFLNSFDAGPLDTFIIVSTIFFRQRLLLFGFGRFNDMRPKYLEDQTPIFKERNENANPRPNTCEDGFYNRVEFESCFELLRPSFVCTNGLRVGSNECVQSLNEGHNVYTYEAECPAHHLICGIRKFYPGNHTGPIPLYGYFTTYICCPVFFPIMASTAAGKTGAADDSIGICGPEGVTISAEEAERSCIPVSGANVKCTTVQKFGRTAGSEITNSTQVDNTTEAMYGYTKNDRWEFVASASVEVKAEIKSGIKFLAEAKVETTGKFGVMVTKDMSSENTSSTTNRLEQAFNFDKAASTEESNNTETTTEYMIEDGQTALFFDIVRRCGQTKIKSEDFIRILTPSIKCKPRLDFEYLFGAPTRNGGYGMANITFFGYGLEIENDTFVTPLDRSVNWARISAGVREKFTNSPVLNDKSNTWRLGFDFRGAPAALWERSTNVVAYNYTFTLNFPNNYRFYRGRSVTVKWKMQVGPSQDIQKNYKKEFLEIHPEMWELGIPQDGWAMWALEGEHEFDLEPEWLRYDIQHERGANRLEAAY